MEYQTFEDTGSGVMNIEKIGEFGLDDIILGDAKFVVARDKQSGVDNVLFFPASAMPHVDAFRLFVSMHPDSEFEAVGGGVIKYDRDEGDPESADQVDPTRIRLATVHSDTLKVLTPKETQSRVLEKAREFYRTL